MLDRMEVQDSAQRVASPRSQQTASSTRDSLQLSIRSAMTQYVFSDVRSLAFHHALGRMCLCSFRPKDEKPAEERTSTLVDFFVKKGKKNDMEVKESDAPSTDPPS